MVKTWVPKAVGWTLHQVSYLSSARAGDWALQIFGRPRAGRHTPADATYLAQAHRQHQHRFQALRVLVHEWNPDGAQTVLLLHGWESNAARWQALIALLLEAGYHVVAPDAPAHGGSDGRLFNMWNYSELIAELVDQWRPYGVVGHSLGGSASCLYASRTPDPLMDRLVIMGVPSEFRGLADYFGNVLGLSPRMRQAMEQRFQAVYNMGYDEVSVEAFCKNIHLPTLVIHDEQDFLSPTDDARRYVQALARGELFLTDGLGHSLQGPAVYHRILSFLKQA